MSDPVDPWDTLSDQWQRGDEAPMADLHAAVKRAYRSANLRLWATVAVEALVVSAVTLWTIHLVREPFSGFAVANVVIAWTVVVTAVTFSIRNRRGIWRAEGETTADYLELCDRRAESKLRTARFVARFAVLLCSTYLLIALGRSWVLSTWATLPAGVLTITGILALYLAWALWFRGRATRELVHARELRAQLLANPDEPEL